MTVCVAAICEDIRIVGAADRMLSTDEIEYEPQQSKIISLTSSIAAMIAGDAAVQGEIFNRVRIKVNARLQADPESWIRVRDVAEMYRSTYREILTDRAESHVLAPLGLDRHSFVNLQQQLNQDLVLSLANDLRTFRFAQTLEVIIVGLDTDGPQPNPEKVLRYPHIYVGFNGDMACYDMIGFAAIGIGRAHAESQFMFAGYDRKWKFPKGLLLTHSAKKRAEVSPGVGKATDMFAIGPGLGSYFGIGNHVIEELDSNYRDTQDQIRKAGVESEQRMTKFDKELATKSKEARQTGAEITQPSNAITSAIDQR